MNRKKRMSDGFTLVEMMITILIIGLIAVLSLPAYSRFMQNWQLNGEADEFAGALRTARSAAVMKNIDAVFIFDTDTNSYFFFEDENRNGSHDHGEYQSQQHELHPGIEIMAHTFSSKVLTFGRMGNTRESGSVTMRNAYNNIRTIRIFGGTGNIVID